MFIVTLCLMFFMVSCGGFDRTTSFSTNNSDGLSTIVSATLTAISSGSPPAESSLDQLPNNTEFTPTSASKLSLDDFQNKKFVGENDVYSIYMINNNNGTDSASTEELLVQNKDTGLVIKMNGLFSMINGGSTIVYDDGNGKYVLLSIGTYSTRNGIVLSLDNQRQVVNDFCMSSGRYGDHIFWNDYIFINNCDNFNNRPWGRGEASSVIAISLKTGSETIIAKSDLTHQYSIRIVEGNTIRYTETYVENEADWQYQDKQRTDDKAYDLTLLGSN